MTPLRRLQIEAVDGGAIQRPDLNSEKMKTKKANKKYKCYLCKNKITKGDQYARKSVVIGKETIYAGSGEVPDWAWTPLRAEMPVCKGCANPKEVEA